MGMNRWAAWITAFSILSPPAFLSAADMGHGGMHGMHGGHEGHQGRQGHKGHDTKPGEMIFSGRIGPWAGEARLIDKKAHMEQSGVPAKFAARFAGERHLMIFLTDPTSGKPASGDAGEVVITGPDKDSSSKVALVFMGDHIGADVDLPKPGQYTFTARIESGGRNGSATFSHAMK